MMTAMIKPPDPHSDSEDSDSRPPPLSTSHTKSLSSKSKSFIYQPNIKSKLLSLKNKTIMQRSSPTKPLSTPNISPSYPIINNTPVIENSSSPPPNYNLHNNPQVNLSSRHSQLPPLSSAPYFHISLFLLILILTIPLMIPSYTMNGNQPNFTLLLHYLLKQMTSR